MMNIFLSPVFTVKSEFSGKIRSSRFSGIDQKSLQEHGQQLLAQAQELRSMGLPPSSRQELYRQALETFTQNKDNEGIGDVWLELGEESLLAGEPAYGVPYFERALARYTTANLPEKNAIAYYNLGLAYDGQAFTIDWDSSGDCLRDLKAADNGVTAFSNMLQAFKAAYTSYASTPSQFPPDKRELLTEALRDANRFFGRDDSIANTAEYTRFRREAETLATQLGIPRQELYYPD